MKRQMTLSGIPIDFPTFGLPKVTYSLCPECGQLIKAVLKEKEGRVVMEKKCPLHGEFEELISPDVEFYLQMEKYFFGDGKGFENPIVEEVDKPCPFNCGICARHSSTTALANIDLTNRCNLECPVCFADAKRVGYLYEPSFEEICFMLKILRERKPIPVPCVQFSGGEPTLHPDFFKILEAAKSMGFSAIQVATNGLKLADIEFAKRAKEAGLCSIYLQFDGFDEEIYLKLRGRNLLDIKLKVIENARKVGMKVVLVPTIARTVNDKEIGKIVRFAIENVDVISGISFQPIAFTGRFDKKEREKLRFTLADLAREIENQVGFIKKSDWLPLCSAVALSHFLSAIFKREVTAYTCHPHCSSATYLFVSPEKEAVPVTRFFKMEEFLKRLEKSAQEIKSQPSPLKILSEAKAFLSLRECFIEEKAPKGLTFRKFLATLFEIISNKYERDESKVGKKSYRSLMVGGMHFMDVYNYDVERVRRCIIHYVAPNGKMYPFCSYNTGPTYRELIEKKFSVPFKKD